MLQRRYVSVGVDTVLLESELPDLLLARDKVDAMYLCSLARVDAEGYLFLCVGISSDRLRDLRSGTVDLRTVLVEPEMGIRYTALSTADADTPTGLELLDLLHELPEAWLPEAGLFLSVFSTKGVSDDVVVQDSMAKNVPVIVCTLDPPEARGGQAKINADTLADYIAHFQSLVRHAAKHKIKRLKAQERKAVEAEDLFSLNVYGFSPGSFNVHFEAKEQPNLWGGSRTSDVLRRLDELMALAKKPAEEAREGFKRNPGHVLGAYESLMKFGTKFPFSYRWSDPGMTIPSGYQISTAEAAAMVAVLEQEEDLKSEPFDFWGYFTSVNIDKRPWSWTARDEEKKMLHGYVEEEYRSLLEGVTIKTQRYQLSGQNRRVQPTTGRPLEKLFLTSVTEA